MRGSCFTLLLVLAGGSLAPAQGEDSILGFPAQAAREQRRWEEKLDQLVRKENLQEWMQHLSAHPHHVGSPWGREVVSFIAELFRSWGYQVEIPEYRVLFPTPKVRLLELVSPHHYRAGLEEPPLPEDSTSHQKEEQLPPYNAYSVDGEVTAELVYVNYGVPSDYEELRRRGIDVAGKIVIARYGGSWRGIKPKVAAEHGALGCILYSDPRDDGYFQGDVYPKGAYRNSWGAQRGSVADMPLFPGDPLTPGRGATADAERLSLQEAPTLTRIPVLPISYADAQPLLAALEGPVAPPSWRGALPITYHLGPGPARVHLKVEFQWDLAPARNVIARWPGSEEPDHWIIRGNHHDAWVNGADDPISGMVALLEEARVLAELGRQGWRPRRTIVYAAWDAEEPGLLGSTEWAEQWREELQQKAVVYLNTDSNGRGFLRMGGSHTLQSFINEVAREVRDPQTGVSVWERLRALRLAQGEEEPVRNGSLPIAALGSGSDYTPFLQHLGIASLNLGFGGEDGGGSYHSVYDSFDHYRRFGDPGFAYGVALVQTCGRAVMRLASAPLLPFDFLPLAQTLQGYVREVEQLNESMRRETDRQNRLLEEKALELAADPTQAFVPPERQPPVPYANFAPLHNALQKLLPAARRYREVFDQWGTRQEELSAARRREWNGRLLVSERLLTREAGLPQRPWFKHYIYAPGFYTGYGVKTLPAVREGLEQRQWERVDQYIGWTAEVIQALAAHLEALARDFQLPSPAH